MESRDAGTAATPPANYFELYALAVEMADRIASRRATANSFFLTVNTGLAAVLGGTDLRWYVAAAGIVFSLAWWALLKSYRDVNAAKFDVIMSMEERLPARVYGDEWARLKPEPGATSGSWLTRYHGIGRVERVVPLVFALIYCVEILRQATG